MVDSRIQVFGRRVASCVPRPSLGLAVFFVALLILSPGEGAAQEPGVDFLSLVGGSLASEALEVGEVEARRISIDVSQLELPANVLEFAVLSGRRFEANLTDMQRRGAGDLTWWGRLSDNTQGRVIFTLKSGLVGGLRFA